MMIWTQARREWHRRRERKAAMDPTAITNAIAAWLNGDERHAMHEGYSVESATVDDTTIVVTLMPLEEGKTQFRVSYQLRAIESQEFSRARHPQSDRKGDA